MSWPTLSVSVGGYWRRGLGIYQPAGHGRSRRSSLSGKPCTRSRSDIEFHLARWSRSPTVLSARPKRAAMMAGRYAHAKQFNRHRRQLRILRTRLGRIIRDIRRKIAGQEQIAAVFEAPPI